MDLDDAAEGEPGPLHLIMTYKAATRHINNIVYGVVEDAEGPQVIRQADDQTWSRLEESIPRDIAAKMMGLRVKLDELKYGLHNEVSRSRAFRILLEDSEGAGNDHLVDYLSRAHGAASNP